MAGPSTRRLFLTTILAVYTPALSRYPAAVACTAQCNATSTNATIARCGAQLQVRATAQRRRTRGGGGDVCAVSRSRAEVPNSNFAGGKISAARGLCAQALVNSSAWMAALDVQDAYLCLQVAASPAVCRRPAVVGALSRAALTRHCGVQVAAAERRCAALERNLCCSCHSDQFPLTADDGARRLITSLGAFPPRVSRSHLPARLPACVWRRQPE
jgi:hypothetical protein